MKLSAREQQNDLVMARLSELVVHGEIGYILNYMKAAGIPGGIIDLAPGEGEDPKEYPAITVILAIDNDIAPKIREAASKILNEAEIDLECVDLMATRDMPLQRVEKE